MKCIFCSIVEKEREAAYVYEDKDFIAIMDKYPINIGHTLVLPKRHYSTLLDMPLNEISKLFVLTAHLAKAVVRSVNSDGFSIGQNNGEAANQLIPHVHVHIVPRHINDMTKWASRRFVTFEQLILVAEQIKNRLVVEEINNKPVI
ncbi:MAG: HIT family protein [Candidatus Nitrosocaldaceae archaeon]